VFLSRRLRRALRTHAQYSPALLEATAATELLAPQEAVAAAAGYCSKAWLRVSLASRGLGQLAEAEAAMHRAVALNPSIEGQAPSTNHDATVHARSPQPEPAGVGAGGDGAGAISGTPAPSQRTQQRDERRAEPVGDTSDVRSALLLCPGAHAR
jgi:hypothetical protein